MGEQVGDAFDVDEAGARLLRVDDTCVWYGGEPLEVDDLADDLGNWIFDGDLEEVSQEALSAMRVPVCPAPTKWRVASQQAVAGRWVPVSSAVLAKAAPVRHTFRVQRSITWSSTIESGLKVGLPLLEAETRVKLQQSVTVSQSESVSYTVPKGRAMCLYAAPGYIRRTLTRTVWGSAMCNQVRQSTTVLTPHRSILKVDNA